MPISYDGEVFRLDTDASSYWFRKTGFGHLEHLHFGERLASGGPQPLAVKRTALYGSSIVYDESDPLYCLDCMCLEWSGVGRGDYRQSPAEIKMPDGSFACDFVFDSCDIVPGAVACVDLPTARAGETDCDTLSVKLCDTSCGVSLTLIYTVFTRENVITRRAVLENHSDRPVSVRRLMSMSVDLPDRGFDMHTFDGGWIREAHHNIRPVGYGTYINSGSTGASGNRHNPGFFLSEQNACESVGRVWGFNLIYSGNHIGLVERSAQDLVRVQLGINPSCFDWTLSPADAFETPESVLSFSSGGFNGLSHNLHEFVNRRIVPDEWQGRERPVLVNNWEAHFFKFTRGKLLRLARRAKKLGAELFVLDDGWFGSRDSDSAGLGDYYVNRKKLSGGLERLSDDIHRLGLDFGLWFEPEMVNRDSDLYRAHPDWAVTTPGKNPCLGRNQLVLNLTRAEVRDYIVENVGSILDSAKIDYVKWDMNRHISDAFSPQLGNQGEFYHRYILGLYDVLRRIFGPRPHILLESCSSGGNRFDLGMLCFSPQIWCSDDTDPVERLKIQGGLSYLYPLSAMGAHVSAAPHQQTLRDTPISTRFNAACFGLLGYELDLKWLTKAERDEVRDQIEFYKAHRSTFQFGRFFRFDARKENKTHWQVLSADGSEAVAGFFQTLSGAAEGYDALPLTGLDPGSGYIVSTRPQRVFIKRFGGLVKHVLPIELNPNGLLLNIAGRFVTLRGCVEQYTAGGDMLMAGLRLNNQFIGSWYNEETRLLGDFGSDLYLITRTT